MTANICKSFAPAGQEAQMRELIQNQMTAIFDDVQIDVLGNLICKTGDAGRLCVECGMDSCGVMIAAKEDGKAFITGVGAITAEYLIGKKIVFANDVFGIVRYDGKTPSDAKLSDLYLETETDKLGIGEFGVVESDYCESRDKLFANGLGDRIAIAAVVEALKKMPKPENLCVVFSAQKRLEARGIQTFLGVNEFEKVITVDSIGCGNAVKSGRGCSLVVVDKAGVCDRELRTQLENLIKEEKTEAVVTVTDENLYISDISTAGKGTACAAIAIPVENKGKSFECVKKSDFCAAVTLLTKAIEVL